MKLSTSLSIFLFVMLGATSSLLAMEDGPKDKEFRDISDVIGGFDNLELTNKTLDTKIVKLSDGKKRDNKTAIKDGLKAVFNNPQTYKTLEIDGDLTSIFRKKSRSGYGDVISKALEEIFELITKSLMESEDGEDEDKIVIDISVIKQLTKKVPIVYSEVQEIKSMSKETKAEFDKRQDVQIIEMTVRETPISLYVTPVGKENIEELAKALQKQKSKKKPTFKSRCKKVIFGVVIIVAETGLLAFSTWLGAQGFFGGDSDICNCTLPTNGTI